MGLPKRNPHHPTECPNPKCKSASIELEEHYPRAPHFMIFSQMNMVGILCDEVIEDWRCTACGHDWRTVEDISPSDYTLENGELKRKDGRPIEAHLLADKPAVNR